MSIKKDDVKNALSTVMDPELKQDLVSLGMIKDIEINGNGVAVTVELTTPACPLKKVINDDCVNAVLKVNGVKSVEVKFTARPKNINKEIKLENVKNLIAVGSGKGGVGKSTVCTFLALAFAKKGYKVGLIDSDAYGPNVPNLLNNFEKPYLHKDNKMMPIETNGIKFISMGLFINPEQPVVWRGPMLHSMVKQFLEDTSWGDLDLLFVDMPPGTGDIQLSLGQLVEISGSIMVTTPQTLSVSDTHKSIGMFRQLGVDIWGIVENMSYFIAPDTGKKYEVFSSKGGEELAKKLNIPLLGQLPLNADISDPTKEEGLKYFDDIVSNIENTGKIK